MSQRTIITPACSESARIDTRMPGPCEFDAARDRNKRETDAATEQLLQRYVARLARLGVRRIVHRMLPRPDVTKELNRSRIKAMRAEARHNDAEALARQFEDHRILDDRTVTGRLRAILAATEGTSVLGINFPYPGLQMGVAFSDKGFLGDRSRGGPGFRDPHRASRNQVGHFLTAVGLSFYPTRLEQTVFRRRMRDWFEAPESMSNEEAAVRLIVGHEKSPDRDPKRAIGAAIRRRGLYCIQIPGLYASIIGADAVLQLLECCREQFRSVVDPDVQAFRQAEAALGREPALDLDAAEPFLRSITLDPSALGNSIQDLRLSLVGVHLGHLISSGHFAWREEVAAWIRLNLKS